jgi:hypothetical protein
MYAFHAYGHHLVRGTHRTTIEFTKDEHLTKRGDCIIGVKADFSLSELKKITGSRACVTIRAYGIEDSVVGTINPHFSSTHELVLRLSEHASERTFLTRTDKAAIHLKRELVEALKRSGQSIVISIEGLA